MSNVGRWDWYYDGKPTEAFGFDDSPAFQICANWLQDCETVADWGCGGGNFSRFVDAARYIGVDGSKTWAVDVVADLEEYHGESDGIFLRGVLEHNYRWEKVLDNALAAFRKRMALVFFSPWHTGPEDAFELQFEAGFEVPTLAFRRGAIEAKLAGLTFELLEIGAPSSAYGSDRVFLIEKPNG